MALGSGENCRDDSKSRKPYTTAMDSLLHEGKKLSVLAFNKKSKSTVLTGLRSVLRGAALISCGSSSGFR
jgi:hypothetical protein